MMLGELIARMTDEAVVEETLFALTDLALLADLRARADASGLELGAYAAAAASRYASNAPEEEWVTLMGAMSRSQDPGSVYLKRAFAYTTRQTATPAQTMR
jgi:hypothetical protein